MNCVNTRLHGATIKIVEVYNANTSKTFTGILSEKIGAIACLISQYSQ